MIAKGHRTYMKKELSRVPTCNAHIPDGYLGCYKDSHKRVLREKTKTFISSNSGDKCKAFCKSAKYRYAGTEYMVECYCGNQIRTQMLSEDCNIRCPGSREEYCGGYWHISIYDTWLCATNPCKHGGGCTDITAHNYTCNCTDQWTGNNCEIELLDDSNKSLLAVYTLIPGFVIVVGLVVIAVFLKRRSRNKNEDTEVIVHGSDFVQHLHENSAGTDHKSTENNISSKSVLEALPQVTEHELNNTEAAIYNEIYSENVVMDTDYNVLSLQHVNETHREFTYDHMDIKANSTMENCYSNMSGSTINKIKTDALSMYSHIGKVKADIAEVDITYDKLENSNHLDIKITSYRDKTIAANDEYDRCDIKSGHIKQLDVGKHSHVDTVVSNIQEAKYKNFNSKTNYLDKENEYAVI
ncbi:uncharacterized protein LOC128545935 isoform X2 [Mercenaria mercenaria]|uniref:uncharacterized protein LOC128545935 isoform X2 n=1 Tax=Mercenaria mercenaria TaxID=6596 RepID=UPI00234EEA09|nr:uncharacterized protein LOC128545935 isoform X2 [Mercenaria mercenaria]